MSSVYSLSEEIENDKRNADIVINNYKSSVKPTGELLSYNSCSINLTFKH